MTFIALIEATITSYECSTFEVDFRCWQLNRQALMISGDTGYFNL
jgi:hypothetical protein